VRKIKHLIESNLKPPTTIFTDHSAILGLAKQSDITTTVSVEKLNLRLVHASEYLSRFQLDIRHKPGKTHIVPDALSRLPSLNGAMTDNAAEGELDALHAESTTLLQLHDEFKSRITAGYETDKYWGRILQQLKDNAQLGHNAAQLPFALEDGLIFRTSFGLSTVWRLCVPQACLGELFKLAHGDRGHPGFTKISHILSDFCIHQLSRNLWEYIRHCPECKVFQTRRHVPFGSMQPIEAPPVPFHTIAMDFILALPRALSGHDTLLTITCKFSKKVMLIPGFETWTAKDWAKAIVAQLLDIDWGMPKAILSDRDPKFLSELWAALFQELGTKLLYAAAYHPQTDGQSERTNQTVESALRYYIHTLENPREWLAVLPCLQFGLNNSHSEPIRHSPNEAVYGFTPNDTVNLLTSSLRTCEVLDLPLARLEISDAIAESAMTMK
jgi:hypothetical protein